MVFSDGGELGTTVTLGESAGVPDQPAATMAQLPRVLLRDTDVDGEPPTVALGSAETAESGNRAGRLQLLGEIGRGGMGAVLKGRDPDLGRDLAVKVLLEEHRDDLEYNRRFVEEAQIAGQLQHPGVAPVYELGAFADCRPYFSMKLVKGRTFAKLLRERENPGSELSKFVGIFEQVCQTIAYAHARGDSSRLEAVERDGGGVRRGAGHGLGSGEGLGETRNRRRSPRWDIRIGYDGRRHDAKQFGLESFAPDR